MIIQDSSVPGLVIITLELDLCCWITDALYWIHPAGTGREFQFIILKDLT